MQRSRATELKVGIFVIVALTIGASVAFVIGEQAQMFQPKVTYYTVFDNVGGLREGSPVRVGGVNVGTVSEVEFQEDGTIEVALDVLESTQHLVRRGSTAELSNKGMLGDKLVNVDVGDGAPLPPGSSIPADTSADMSDYLDRAGRILTNVEKTSDNLREGSKPLGEPEFAKMVRRTVKNLERVSSMAAEGNGALQRLLTDPQVAQQMTAGVRNFQTASQALAGTARDLRSVTREVRTGDGTVHELIYGEEGTRMMTGFADAAGELAQMLRSVRTGDGTMHKLVYENKGDKIVDNLTKFSNDLRAISSQVREGKGTLGGLLTDPSIYEDVKRLVGDLQRNEILRALVRYSIRRDEKVEATNVEPKD